MISQTHFCERVVKNTKYLKTRVIFAFQIKTPSLKIGIDVIPDVFVWTVHCLHYLNYGAIYLS